jgi:flagellar hook capping protein FlgD
VGEYSSTYSSTLASSTLASRAVTPDRRAWIELPASSDMLRLLASTNPPVPEGKLKVAVGALEGVTDLDLRSMVAVESYTFTAMEGGIGRGAKIFIDGTGVEEPDRMSVCRLEQQGWQVLPTVFDPETDQFSASAAQDGTYALLAFGPGSSQLPRAGKFNLGQNSPNPFNPSTFISFSVPGDEPVEGFSLKVFNVRGQVVGTLIKGTVRPGTHTVQWTGKADNGRDLSSGVYFSRLSAPGTSMTRKMILLR